MNVTVQPTRDVRYCDGVLRELWAENWFDGCRMPEQLTLQGAIGRRDQVILRVRVGAVDGGLFRLEEQAPGLWEGHSQLLKSCRGNLAMAAYEECLRYVFRKLKAQRLSGYAPQWQRHAIWFAVKMGFRINGREKTNVSRNGEMGKLTVYSMTRSDYFRRKMK